MVDKKRESDVIVEEHVPASEGGQGKFGAIEVSSGDDSVTVDMLPASVVGADFARLDAYLLGRLDIDRRKTGAEARAVMIRITDDEVLIDEDPFGRDS